MHAKALCFCALVSTLWIVISTTPIKAQITLMEQTPQLQRLQPFLGDWVRHDATSAGGGPQPQTVYKSVRWAPGDTWMSWDVEIHFNNGQVVAGRRHLAWDTENSHYRTIWIDTQSAHLIAGTAEWDADDALVVTGDPIPWQDGHEYRFRTRYAFASPAQMQETGWRSVDGGDYVQYNDSTWDKVAAVRVMAPQRRALSAFDPDPSRRFDFWIGDWTVNLRILQEDGTFLDSIEAHPSIYSILGGKAILELWDSERIKGYSLRYYDAARQKWVLWLCWPGPNRSRVSSLEGNFRNGRGNFTTSYTDAHGNEVLQRYSFNDITPFSLRWDDLRSVDGGKTWSKNWIMEWSRVAVDPRWPIADGAVPTMADGDRCSDAAFRHAETIAGHWQADGVRLDAYRVLDGCAVMAFLDTGDAQEFLFITYTGTELGWGTDVLDDHPGSGLLRYRSADNWSRLKGSDGKTLEWSVRADTLEYQRGEVHLQLHRTP